MKLQEELLTETDRLNRIFDEGYENAWKGIIKNPYLKNTKEWDNWQSGYLAACKWI